jgi:LacI family transcriptional regulator
MVFHITNGFNPLNTNNVGGVIFADVIENRRQVEAAVAAQTPCMVINNKVVDLDVNYIAVNNVKGGETAADYLVSLRHKRIAIITGNLNTQAGYERLKGFKSMLKENKIVLPKEYVYEGDYSRRCARLAAEELLSLSKPPTAIFACSDDMALEVVAVCNEKGVKIPEELSVIGFDDNPSCLFSSVALTTVRQPLFKMAEESVKVLQSIVTGKSKKKCRKVLSPDLVVRESCAPCLSQK